jgi:hypothetical protein
MRRYTIRIIFFMTAYLLILIGGLWRLQRRRRPAA